MQVNIGFLNPENNIYIKSLNYNTQNIESTVVTADEISNSEFNLLFFDNDTNFEPIEKLLQKEEKIYPILDINSVDLDQNKFMNLDFDKSSEIFLKVLGRWVLTKNMLTIENLHSHINDLKSLWTKNRDKFFEDFWYLLKRNLGSVELRIIFNDLSTLTAEQEEKGEKPSLIHSYLSGNKTPTVNKGGDVEAALMQDYKKDFSSELNITEYSADTGQLVMVATIEKSPILIMAKVKSFNQLQRSVIHGLFNGLNGIKHQTP